MISDEQLLHFCRNLSASVQSGLALGDSFETLSQGDDLTAQAVRGSADRIAAGETLHESFAAQGRFPPVFVSLFRAGEESGKLDYFLDRFIACLEVRIEFKRRLARALAYPIFVLLLTAVLLVVFYAKALPILLEPLQEAGIALATDDIWLGRLGAYGAEHWRGLAAFGLAGFVLLTAFLRSGAGRKTAAVACQWMPGLRFATEHARRDLFLTTTGLLMESGMSLSAAMDVLRGLFQDDPPTRRRLERAAKELSGGRSLSASLSSLLTLEDLRSLENAEKAGRLSGMFLTLGKTHRDLQRHRLGLLVVSSKIASSFVFVAFVGGLMWTVLQPVVALLDDPSILLRR